MIVPIEPSTQKTIERRLKMTNGKTLSLVRMSDVQLQEVKWLWKPYIPFGKLTIIQGDPGEGKTTFALQLAAACSSGVALPGMEIAERRHRYYGCIRGNRLCPAWKLQNPSM